jgi:hypothetical protein
MNPFQPLATSFFGKSNLFQGFINDNNKPKKGSSKQKLNELKKRRAKNRVAAKSRRKNRIIAKGLHAKLA